MRAFPILLAASACLLAGCAAVPAVQPSRTAMTTSERPPSPAATTSPPPVRSPSPTAKPAVLSPSDLAAFRREFGPDAAVAAVPLDGSEPAAAPLRGDPYAWSTIKVVIVAQTLMDAGGPGGLSRSERELIRRALSASDNEAAAQLHEQIMARHGGLLGAAREMERLLRRAGDDQTVISTRSRAGFSTYGQTLWQPREQVRFLAALARGCLLDPAATDYLIGELGHVVPDQRWGLGLVAAPSFKGGWGPDPDGRYLVRQLGLVRAGGGQAAVAIAVRPADGSFETGKAELGRMATWLTDRVGSVPAAEPCR